MHGDIGRDRCSKLRQLSVKIFYSTLVCLSPISESSEGDFKFKERWVFFTVCVRGGPWEQRKGGGLHTQRSSIYLYFYFFICFSLFSGCNGEECGAPCPCFQSVFLSHLTLETILTQITANKKVCLSAASAASPVFVPLMAE